MIVLALSFPHKGHMPEIFKSNPLLPTFSVAASFLATGNQKSACTLGGSRPSQTHEHGAWTTAEESSAMKKDSTEKSPAKRGFHPWLFAFPPMNMHILPLMFFPVKWYLIKWFTVVRIGPYNMLILLSSMPSFQGPSSKWLDKFYYPADGECHFNSKVALSSRGLI